MHPIERLRAVARASGVGQALLVRETAGALASLGLDPAGTVTACRRMLARHPTSGPLWWLSARILTAADPRAEAWRAVDEIDADATPTALAEALPEEATVCVLGWPEQVGEALPRRGDLEVLVVDALEEGRALVRRLLASEVDALDVPLSGLAAAAAASDLVLVEASAVGPTGLVAVAGSRAAAAVATQSGVPVWAVAGVGRLLPAPMWNALTRRLQERDEEPWECDDELVPIDLVGRLVGPRGPLPVAEALAVTSCPVAPELFRDAG